jgi:arsenate reductase
MAKKNVLILCTGNSARSQMAEGLLRSLGGERFEAHSAGLEPKDLHPLAIRAMDEIGIDIRGQRSKDVGEYLGRLAVHHLITVCENASQRCPTSWPGLGERIHWPIDDPAAVEGSEAERLAAFRRARDDLRQRLAAWLASTAAGGRPGGPARPAAAG